MTAKSIKANISLGTSPIFSMGDTTDDIILTSIGEKPVKKKEIEVEVGSKLHFAVVAGITNGTIKADKKSSKELIDSMQTINKKAQEKKDKEAENLNSPADTASELIENVRKSNITLGPTRTFWASSDEEILFNRIGGKLTLSNEERENLTLIQANEIYRGILAGQLTIDKKVKDKEEIAGLDEEYFNKETPKDRSRKKVILRLLDGPLNEIEENVREFSSKDKELVASCIRIEKDNRNRPVVLELLETLSKPKV